MEGINRIDKPCVILAGAGTGKTYTIVEKLKTLVKEKVCRPSRIVCITFSNEAADTISMRVRSFMGGSEQEMPIVRTFHGFSADLLRENGEKVGVNKEFKILDDDSAKIVLHSSLKVAPYYCHKYVSAISAAKDLGITLQDMEAYLSSMHSGDFSSIESRRAALQFAFQTSHDKDDKEQKRRISSELLKLTELIEFRKFVQSWKSYEKIKSKQNYLDYSDLNSCALKLLRQDNAIAERYDYIIVDEFQDTNKVQLDLIFNLARKGNITIVGDMNQSIYRFRGAYKGNFDEFLTHYGLTRKDVFTLSSSYRSTNKILRAAHRVICNNYASKDECFEVKSATGKEGDNVEVYELVNAREEARKIAELCEEMIGKGMRKEEICIMTRTHQQCQLIKKALDMKGINYSSLERPSLLKQKNVKIVLDYLSIVNCLSSGGKGGGQAWWDLVYQSGLKASDLISISKFIKEKRKEELAGKAIRDGIDSVELSDEGKKKISFMISKIDTLLEHSKESAVTLIQKAYEILGIASLATEEKSDEARNLTAFIDFVKERASFAGTDLAGLIYHLGIISALGIDVPVASNERNGINIMTSHATKGLEYKAVIVSNVAQKRFPLLRTMGNSLLPLHLHPEIRSLTAEMRAQRIAEWEEFERMHQLHEERRLFYVACTRAKDKLILTYALDYGGKKHTQSQFLEEMQITKSEQITFVVDKDERYSLLEDGKANIDESLLNTGEGIENLKFSPSSLLLFDECQKKYEYKYVFNMPEEEIVDWQAIRLGSFVHLVLEEGVNEAYTTEKQFIDFARLMHEKPEWNEVDMKDAETMVRVFFERNKGKYSRSSMTEQYLNATIDGLKFQGYADRIDLHEDGVEIVDYKTSRSQINPKHRRWQLGFYALAAQQKYGKVKALTLDMLRLEKPLSFAVDSAGNATAKFSDRMEGFNIGDVRDELLAAARVLISAYKEGFKPCPADKHCEFCSEYVYKT